MCMELRPEHAAEQMPHDAHRGPTHHDSPTCGIAGCLGPSVRGLRGMARPSPGGDKDRRGRRQALPGCQEAQGARPARAHQGGRRVLARLSCSSRSGLALRAGLGRLGAPGGRGSLWGPAQGEPRGGHGSQPLPRDGPHPHGIPMPRSRQDPGTLTRRLSRSPPNPDPSMSMKVWGDRQVTASPGPPSRPAPCLSSVGGACPGLMLPASPAHAAHSWEDPARSHSRKGPQPARREDPEPSRPHGPLLPAARKAGADPQAWTPSWEVGESEEAATKPSREEVPRPGAAGGPVLGGTTAATHQLVMPEGGSWWPWRPLGSWRSSRPDPSVPLGIKESSYVRVHGPRCLQGWGAGGPGPQTLTFSPLGPASPGVPGKPCGPGSPWKTKTSSSVREWALCRRRQVAGQTAEPGGAAGGGTRNCVFQSIVRLVFSRQKLS